MLGKLKHLKVNDNNYIPILTYIRKKDSKLEFDIIVTIFIPKNLQIINKKDLGYAWGDLSWKTSPYTTTRYIFKYEDNWLFDELVLKAKEVMKGRNEQFYE